MTGVSLVREAVWFEEDSVVAAVKHPQLLYLRTHTQHRTRNRQTRDTKATAAIRTGRQRRHHAEQHPEQHARGLRENSTAINKTNNKRIPVPDPGPGIISIPGIYVSPNNATHKIKTTRRQMRNTGYEYDNFVSDQVRQVEFLIIINVNELLWNPLSGRVLLFTWVFYEPLVATGKGTDSLGEILPQRSFVSLWLLLMADETLMKAAWLLNCGFRRHSSMLLRVLNETAPLTQSLLWLLDLLRLSCSPAPVWAEIRLWPTLRDFRGLSGTPRDHY
ncbi:hypothetical protein ACLKA7_001990 [Drosophila subpalustris]